MGKYDEFGALLASYRRDKGLNQIALAEQCGVKQSRISHFETGRSRPKAELLECFARALQLTPYQKKRLLLSAGYVEDGEQKLSEILIDSELRPIFILLSDPVLSNIPIPLAKTTIKDLTKGWHLYVQAKEKQLKREWSGTEEICELALEIIQTASTHLVAYLYDAVGSAAIHRGNFNEAEDRFDHVEILLSKVNDAYLEGKLLVHQGELLRFQSDWPQSEKKFLDAKKIFLDLTKTESLKQCAWVDRKIGVLYLMQGKWKREIVFSNEVKRPLEIPATLMELAKTCNALGWGYTLRGDWHKALGYHLEGYRLTQDHRVMD